MSVRCPGGRIPGDQVWVRSTSRFGRPHRRAPQQRCSIRRGRRGRPIACSRHTPPSNASWCRPALLGRTANAPLEAGAVTPLDIDPGPCPRDPAANSLLLFTVATGSSSLTQRGPNSKPLVGHRPRSARDRPVFELSSRGYSRPRGRRRCNQVRAPTGWKCQGPMLLANTLRSTWDSGPVTGGRNLPAHILRKHVMLN
jgi:hypothetical protein